MSDRDVAERMTRAAETVYLDSGSMVRRVLEVAERRKRHRVRVAGVGVVTVIVAVVGYGWFRPAEQVPASTVVVVDVGENPELTEFTMSSDERFGITMGINRTYAEDTELDAGTLRVDDLRSRGEYFRSVDADNDGLDLEHVDIPGGTSVSLQATVKPSCDDPDFAPEISFTLPGSLSGHRKIIDVVQPSNPEEYATQLRIFCRIGLQIRAGGTAHAEFTEAGLQIANGTDHDIVVSTPALVSGTAIWRAASKTIAAHEEEYLLIKGSGVRCDAGQELPWSKDRLRITGTTVVPTFSSDWCAYGDVD